MKHAVVGDLASESTADDASVPQVQNRSESGPTIHGTEPDRVSILWRATPYILLVTALVALGVYGVSKSLTPLYSASATVRITATQSPGGSATDVATASNDIAAQYAELVTSAPVLDPAAKSVGATASILSAHLSAGTVSSQNLVRVKAQSASRGQSAQWANAVATSLAHYVSTQSAAQTKSVQAALDAQLKPIDANIAQLQREIAAVSSTAVAGSAGYVKLQSSESQLTELLTSRADLLTTTAVSIASDEPQVQVLSAAGPPTQVSPKPTLYTIIAALGALLIASEIALLVARRRSLRGV